MKKIVLLPAFAFCYSASAQTVAKDCTKCTITPMEQWLAFAPIAVFLVLVAIIFWKLNKEDYKLGDALKENTTIEISEDNPAIADTTKPATNGIVVPPVPPAVPNPVQPPFVPKTIQPKSTSRLLVFISGVVSLGLASCICSFWMYGYFDGGKNIDIAGLTNVLLALGIGVVPYAVNKLSTNK